MSAPIHKEGGHTGHEAGQAHLSLADRGAQGAAGMTWGSENRGCLRTKIHCYISQYTQGVVSNNFLL